VGWVTGERLSDGERQWMGREQVKMRRTRCRGASRCSQPCANTQPNSAGEVACGASYSLTLGLVLNSRWSPARNSGSFRWFRIRCKYRPSCKGRSQVVARARSALWLRTASGELALFVRAFHFFGRSQGRRLVLGPSRFSFLAVGLTGPRNLSWIFGLFARAISVMSRNV
jgi:hypothetical protein